MGNVPKGVAVTVVGVALVGGAVVLGLNVTEPSYGPPDRSGGESRVSNTPEDLLADAYATARRLPDSIFGWERLQERLARMERFEEFVAVADEIEQVGPHMAGYAHTFRAHGYALTGRLDEAVEEIRAAYTGDAQTDFQQMFRSPYLQPLNGHEGFEAMRSEASAAYAQAWSEINAELDAEDEASDGSDQ